MTCRFASTCPHEGTVLVRIHGVGDRKVCPEHVSWMRDHAMDYRELPIDAHVPAWRQRSLARDMTNAP
jgi:hypothetical protein